jgi:hypothetical protein
MRDIDAKQTKGIVADKKTPENKEILGRSTFKSDLNQE